MYTYEFKENKFGKEILVPTTTIPTEFFSKCLEIPGIRYHKYHPKGFEYFSDDAKKRLELVLKYGETAFDGVTATRKDRPKSVKKPTHTKAGHPFDPDQMAIIDYVYYVICKVLSTGDDSYIYRELLIAVNAYPGTGKTTVLVAIAEMLAQAFPDLPILTVSFTNTAVNEFRDRLGSYTNVTVSTIHKMAHGAVKNYFGREWICAVQKQDVNSFKAMLNSKTSKYSDNNENKIYHIMRLNDIHVRMSKRKKGYVTVISKQLTLYKSIVSLLQGYDIDNNDIEGTIDVIKRHKSSLFKYFTPNSEFAEFAEDIEECAEDFGGDVIDYEEIAKTALRILKLSDRHYKIDYPDFNNVFQKVLWRTEEYCRVVTRIIPEALKLNQYKIILLDEYQDSNKSQHIFVRRLKELCNAGIVAIGNIEQAIYTYSGCMNGYALQDFINDKTFKKFTLRYNRRSTKNVIHEWAAVFGLVVGKDIMPVKDFKLFSDKNTLSFEEVLEKVTDGDAILVHYNKDVFTASLAVIEAGKFISLKNTKFYDNFKDLVKPIYESKEKTVGGIKQYYYSEIAKFISWGEEKFEDKIYELQQTLAVISKFLKLINLSDNDSFTKLFDYLDTRIRPNGITVSTIHTSKGCEYNNVFCDKIHNFNIEDENPIFAQDEKCKKLVMLSRARFRNFYFDISKKVSVQKTVELVAKHDGDIVIVIEDKPEKPEKTEKVVVPTTPSANKIVKKRYDF